MGWLRRRRTLRRQGRHRPSGADPVATALAEARTDGPLVRRHADLAPVLAELPDWFDVEDSDDLPGFDTVVTLADEIHAYTDPATDGLEPALREQPGIEEVLHEGREVLYLRTRLALTDVAAAVVRAVVDVNRDPRPEPATGELGEFEVAAAADLVAPLLEALGMVRRPGPRGTTYFDRRCEDGFGQVVVVASAAGELTDGTALEGRLTLQAGVRVPELAQASPLSPEPDRVVPADCCQQIRLHPAPLEVEEATRAEVLPWLHRTRNRSALAAWVAEDPSRLWQPVSRPTYARVLATWGHRDAARAVLAHLDAEWPKIARAPEVAEVRRMVDSS